MAILHGWSDDSKSFHPLRRFLRDHGFAIADIWLGDYVSLDDDVRVEDVAKRMDRVVGDLLQSGKLSRPFDLVVHSTGGLVVREWLSRFYPDGRGAPVKRVLMLAPANFGSKLATVGKSMFGRVVKGFGNHFETGQEMLNALELGSPYQWDLTSRDLIARPGAANPTGPFGRTKIWPFVIVGTRAYDSGVRQIVNENGSDGTVRVAAANLNCVGMTIDFTAEDGAAAVTPWPPRTDLDIPFAVLPERDHGEITHPADSGNSVPPYDTVLGQLIVEALQCPDIDTYGKIAARWQAISDATADLAEHPERIAAVFEDQDRPSPDHFHRYLQVNVVVRDDYGQPLKDYFLEFAEPTGDEPQRDATLLTFHKDVLESVHVNSVDSAYRCLFIDHTDLMRIFYDRHGASSLAISLSALAPGRNIKYFSTVQDAAVGQVELHAADVQARDALSGQSRLYRNMTHLVEVIVPRRPVDDVFRLSQPPEDDQG